MDPQQQHDLTLLVVRTVYSGVIGFIVATAATQWWIRRDRRRFLPPEGPPFYLYFRRLEPNWPELTHDDPCEAVELAMRAFIGLMGKPWHAGDEGVAVVAAQLVMLINAAEPKIRCGTTIRVHEEVVTDARTTSRPPGDHPLHQHGVHITLGNERDGTG